MALISRKGGSGKTTLAVALAVAHEQAGGVAVVVDLDPQGSARTWSELRRHEPPLVVSARPQTLGRVLQAARSAGTTLALVDTGPREGGGTREAARQADFVLIPSRPAAYDLATVPDTLGAIAPDETLAAIVLTCCPPRGPLPTQAAEYIRGIGPPGARTTRGRLCAPLPGVYRCALGCLVAGRHPAPTSPQPEHPSVELRTLGTIPC